jgi:hypothetical protein
MMTAVNNTIHTNTGCARSSFGYPLLSLSETRTLSERLPVFSVNNFFFRNGFYFFLRMAMAFPCARPQATVAPKRLGWITKRLSKKPGSGVSVLVFAHGVSGGGKEWEWEQRACRLFFIILFLSTVQHMESP